MPEGKLVFQGKNSAVSKQWMRNRVCGAAGDCFTKMVIGNGSQGTSETSRVHTLEDFHCSIYLHGVSPGDRVGHTIPSNLQISLAFP